MTNLDKLILAVISDVTQYEEQLTYVLKNNLTNQEFDKFDDYLIALIESNPTVVKEISIINLRYFKKVDNPFWLGYTFNTLIISLLKTNSFDLIFPYTKQALLFCMGNKKMYAPGHSICSNLKNNYNALKQDELIQILKLNVDFYKKYDKNKLAVKNMLQASLIFSNFGSYQAAYRLIADAEEFCGEKKLQLLHADVIATLATISMEEGDFPFAESTFEKSFTLYSENNKPIPYRHLFNWGTTLIRTQRYSEAEDVYNTIKSNYPKYKDPRIDLNLAITYKNQLKYDLAIAVLKQLEPQIEPENSSEWIMEYYLILSNVLALNAQYDSAVIALNKCVFAIEKYLFKIFRFHYRRGIRSKYYRRIVDVLQLVFPVTNPMELINVLVYLKLNSQSDWLSIIDWVEQIKNNSDIDIKDKTQLNDKFSSLLNFGGVIVNSFKEKYDDPFEDPSIDEQNNYLPLSHHLPWQELTLIIQMIVEKYSLDSPYQLSSIKKLSSVLKERIKYSAVLFVFIVKEKYLIYNISNNINNVYEIESDVIIEHSIKLLHYRNPTTEAVLNVSSPKEQFRSSLESLTFKLSYILNDLINFIVSEKKLKITIIPDVFDSSLPLSATFFSVPELEDLFLSGQLTIESIPVLYKGYDGEEKIDSTSVITNKYNSLDLFEEEGKLLEKHFHPHYKKISVDKNNRLLNWSTHLQKSKSIHVISHGSPISFYTDPAFAALDGESLSLSSFQNIFLNSRCSLFVLNACNSGDTVNNNFHIFFKSYEAISFVSILLQNRRSKVIAAQWPVLDTFSYIFTAIFYEKIKNESNICNAFAQTIAEIKRSDKQHFLTIVKKIENETIRTQKEELIVNASSNEPFDRVLMFGCLNIYGLL
jgi:tetratricopeptide (TPR) repeat protein